MSDEKTLNDPMTPEELQASRARVDAATPGPWWYKLGALKAYVYSTDPGEELGFSMQVLHPDDGRDVPAAENAEFIAHARTDVPRLHATIAARDEEIERLQAEVARLQQQPDEWEQYRARNER